MSSLNKWREFSKKQLISALVEVASQRNELGRVLMAIHTHMITTGSMDLVDYYRVSGVKEEEGGRIAITPQEDTIG